MRQVLDPHVVSNTEIFQPISCTAVVTFTEKKQQNVGPSKRDTYLGMI